MTTIRTIGTMFAATAAAALCLTAAAGPAMASTPAKAVSGPAAVATDAGASRKICLSQTTSGASTVTGSSLKREQCKTRAQWEAKGVTFQAKAR